MTHSSEDNEVTLTLSGARTERGIALGDLEAFVEAFVGTLRYYDRARRGEETRRQGGPGSSRLGRLGVPDRPAGAGQRCRDADRGARR